MRKKRIVSLPEALRTSPVTGIEFEVSVRAMESIIDAARSGSGSSERAQECFEALAGRSWTESGLIRLAAMIGDCNVIGIFLGALVLGDGPENGADPDTWLTVKRFVTGHIAACRHCETAIRETCGVLPRDIAEMLGGKCRD